MSWLSEAHEEWHLVNGKYACCPLDCGASEFLQEPDYDETDFKEFSEASAAEDQALINEVLNSEPYPYLNDPPF
jgi:hypothetical protein